MSHTYTNLLTHVIFSTKDRVPSIGPKIRSDAHAYLGGIVRELNGATLIGNGTADHVHLLLKLPAELAIADCIQVLKANSSRWLHRKQPSRRTFAWQTGYGAFTVSTSSVESVCRYIRNQEEHHKRISFRDEFLAFLRKQGIPFDERYVFE